jgi:hypothetical protein
MNFSEFFKMRRNRWEPIFYCPLNFVTLCQALQSTKISSDFSSPTAPAPEVLCFFLEPKTEYPESKHADILVVDTAYALLALKKKKRPTATKTSCFLSAERRSWIAIR